MMKRATIKDSLNVNVLCFSRIDGYGLSLIGIMELADSLSQATSIVIIELRF
jgi:hypothetical protein